MILEEFNYNLQQTKLKSHPLERELEHSKGSEGGYVSMSDDVTIPANPYLQSVFLTICLAIYNRCIGLNQFPPNVLTCYSIVKILILKIEGIVEKIS